MAPYTPAISRSMSEISDAIQAKCLAFSDRIIKLNDYLLEQASQKYDGGSKRYDLRKRKSALSHQPSYIFLHKTLPSYILHLTYTRVGLPLVSQFLWFNTQQSRTLLKISYISPLTSYIVSWSLLRQKVPLGDVRRRLPKQE